MRARISTEVRNLKITLNAARQAPNQRYTGLAGGTTVYRD